MQIVLSTGSWFVAFVPNTGACFAAFVPKYWSSACRLRAKLPVLGLWPWIVVALLLVQITGDCAFDVC